MVGSVADAEDMLQETFIRWQQASEDEIQSPRSYLVTIISRLCINHLQSARVQREKYFGQWLPEPLVTGHGSDPMELIRADETLSMAFLVLLERLTPIERAVFLFAKYSSTIMPKLPEYSIRAKQIAGRFYIAPGNMWLKCARGSTRRQRSKMSCCMDS